MKSIERPEDKEKRDKRNKLILGVILIGLMVLSSAGYALIYGFGGTTDSGASNSEQYFDGQYWVIDLGGKILYSTTPKESAANVSVVITKQLIDYRDRPLYVDAESQEVLQLMAANIGSYASRFQEACYGACERNLPEKNCTENMIIWRVSDERKVYQENNCVFIDGDIGAVDAFFYRLFGVS